MASRVIREFDRDAIVPYLRPVAEARAHNRNLRPSEVEAMFRIVVREEQRLENATARRSHHLRPSAFSTSAAVQRCGALTGLQRA